MAGDECLPMKMKRKEIDRVNDEFHDFSLSSPARKIRRLDVDLPPIMEEEEAEIPVTKLVIEELEAEPVAEIPAAKPVIEELEANQERAIVLFKSVEGQQPSSGSLFVDSNLISGFKYQLLRPSYSSNPRPADTGNDEDESSNRCLAVVPWIPYHAHTTEFVQQTQNSPEMMQSDDMGDEIMGEATIMEIEDDNNNSTSLPRDQLHHEGLPQWQQPHCMIPQPPLNNSTPISWSSDYYVSFS